MVTKADLQISATYTIILLVFSNIFVLSLATVFKKKIPFDWEKKS